MKTLSLLRLVPLSFFAVVVACGSSNDGDGNGGNGSGDGSGDGNGVFSGNLGEGNGDGDASSDPACAAQTANADRRPAHLFIALDQSASMDTPNRWPPVTAALTAFLDDPLSTGISAALELFPSESGSEACNASSYTEMDVPLTALPGSAAFSSTWPATPNIYRTPTRALLEGLTQVAKAHAEANPDVSTAIVLITDGYPQTCSDNSIEEAAAVAEGVKDVVPTYVIGVGNGLDNLNLIAEKGGTGAATLIDVDDPTNTQKQFLDTINTIRGATLSCDLDIPPAPAGQTLDLNKVNVSYTPGSGGAPQPLGFDEACTAGGWRFDPPSAPTKIVLCGPLCDTVKADPTGVVSVEFGCEQRRVDIPR